MTDPIDLDAIEAVARAAQIEGAESYSVERGENGPGGWDRLVMVHTDEGGYRAKGIYAVVPGPSEEGDGGESQAAFIATANPATILSLVSELRVARERLAMAAAFILPHGLVEKRIEGWLAWYRGSPVDRDGRSIREVHPTADAAFAALAAVKERSSGSHVLWCRGGILCECLPAKRPSAKERK